ncbi:Spy/CpxP family protein refolding chaperone [Geobacter sp. AOG2]|uniref:Spy/CpxP family protein refolding chaperone n=1 Tax=Geobacter sp. AOG2 TaxID=1566347 RepID=UPI001CC4BA9C|nr:Spy/CpxP family protein refolding chaperone [Geobacter sp. AOG2]
MAKIVVLLCIGAITAFAGMAQADDGGWDSGHCGNHMKQRMHHNFKRIAKKLGLTEAQKAQAKAIFQANRDAMKPIFASLRTERKNLQALIHADTIDEAAIRAETAKVAGIQADLNVGKAKAGAQFRAILTPAQLETLKTMHDKRRMKDAPAAPPAQ